MPALDWGSPMAALDEAAVARLVSVVGDRGCTALAMIQVRHLGGALGRPAVVPAAAGHLEAPYLVFAFGVPAVPELVEPIRGSLAALAAVCEPGPGQVPRTFVTGGAPVSTPFGDEALARLRAVKVRVDPEGIIRGNHPLM